jgi:hypothetical protein
MPSSSRRPNSTGSPSRSKTPSNWSGALGVSLLRGRTTPRMTQRAQPATSGQCAQSPQVCRPPRFATSSPSNEAAVRLSEKSLRGGAEAVHPPRTGASSPQSSGNVWRTHGIGNSLGLMETVREVSLLAGTDSGLLMASNSPATPSRLGVPRPSDDSLSHHRLTHPWHPHRPALSGQPPKPREKPPPACCD